MKNKIGIVFDFNIKSRRAEQLLPADYSTGKPLKIALENYVKILCENIKNQ